MFQGIDLHSDTQTRPTAQMLKAMTDAEVGDEQMGEDPTTLLLEEKVAELTGKTAAFFFPSATMANQIALKIHCEPGDEILGSDSCHLFTAEAGGPAIHSGLMARPIPTPTGIFSGEDLRKHYRLSTGPHYPVSQLVTVENTTNTGGGLAWTQEELNSILDAAKDLGLKTHLDGARLFNAVIKSGLSPKSIAGRFDSVTVCLSKGLGCAVGAVLAFDRIHRVKVRRWKQLFGGALRQSGILAAAGLYALENHVHRLAEDHENAAFLREGLQDVPHLFVENHPHSTNMVYFSWIGKHATYEQFQKKCADEGVRFSHVPNTHVGRFRAVTHLNLSKSDIEKALKIIRKVCNDL